jgi:hypothetical protein
MVLVLSVEQKGAWLEGLLTDRDVARLFNMLRSEADRERRQQEMLRLRERAAAIEQEHADLLTLDEAAALLRVGRSTARRMLLHEPGVHLLRTPGSRRMMMRIPRSVIERILRRTANQFHN